jgi:hypothetical protein
MTMNEASERAARLGLSAWVSQVDVVAGRGAQLTVKCVGFGNLEVAVGEGETWDEAFGRATNLIFAAR